MREMAPRRPPMEEKTTSAIEKAAQQSSTPFGVVTLSSRAGVTGAAPDNILPGMKPLQVVWEDSIWTIFWGSVTTPHVLAHRDTAVDSAGACLPKRAAGSAAQHVDRHLQHEVLQTAKHCSCRDRCRGGLTSASQAEHGVEDEDADGAHKNHDQPDERQPPEAPDQRPVRLMLQQFLHKGLLLRK
ncbi:hypothetical protein MMC29_001514 [Sticta canariensis]|nr:hypothetical protein [Sticta canariensis]